MLDQIIARQLKLQRESFGIDPQNLEGQARDHYVQAMALALDIEIGEALQEISWKPWASGTWFNREEYLMELIDALHFWVNLALVATDDPQEILDVYLAKADVNAKRQRDGYTGVKTRESGFRDDA